MKLNIPLIFDSEVPTGFLTALPFQSIIGWLLLCEYCFFECPSLWFKIFLCTQFIVDTPFIEEGYMTNRRGVWIKIVARTGEIITFGEFTLRALRKQVMLRKNYVWPNRSPLKVLKKSGTPLLSFKVVSLLRDVLNPKLMWAKPRTVASTLYGYMYFAPISFLNCLPLW